MKTISATEAKNNFGELLRSIHSGPVGITRNGHVIAEVRAASQRADVPRLDAQTEEKLLRAYASGRIARAQLQEQSGFSFGEVLAGLARLGLSLPVVRTSDRYNAKQRALYRKLFGGS